MYDEAMARTESIMSYSIRMRGNCTGFNPERDLRIAWNKFVSSRTRQTKMMRGRW